MKHVIVGTGIAGTAAAEALRRLDPEAEIILIGDEPGPPYCRPMIAMVLEGAASMGQLPIRGPGFYEDLQIRKLLGQRIQGIDVGGRTVRFADGRTEAFDRLLIATGADPRPIKAQGLDLDNLFFMRTAHQVQAMQKVLPSARQALVLGGGLVGFKAAYGLLRRGLKVTMLIRSGYPLSLQVDAAAGGMILRELKSRGLDVRVGLEVTAFEGQGRVREALISDGTRIPCDLVVIGKGVLPALSFVPREEIHVDLGILVDAHLQTSVPGIYAAGDVAESVDIARDTRWVNAIWPEAVTQGRIAGMNMAGRPVTYRGSLSRNVIRIFGLDVLTVGWVDPPASAGCEVYAHFDRRGNTYRKVVLKDGRLIGCTLVNGVEQGGVLTALIHSRQPVTVPPEALMSPSFNLKPLMEYAPIPSRPSRVGAA